MAYGKVIEEARKCAFALCWGVCFFLFLGVSVGGGELDDDSNGN